MGLGRHVKSFHSAWIISKREARLLVRLEVVEEPWRHGPLAPSTNVCDPAFLGFRLPAGLKSPAVGQLYSISATKFPVQENRP
jgi:hypothetical protein